MRWEIKSLPPLAAAVKVALIGLAHDGDSGVLVILVAGRSVVGRVAGGVFRLLSFMWPFSDLLSTFLQGNAASGITVQ